MPAPKPCPASPEEKDHLVQEPEIGRALLAWFGAHQRPLPWRRTKNPYHIWVSEVMAQQTRIETMLPYYHQFLQVFPSIQKLADSPLEDVLSIWAGLGYYRRAENMHRAAKAIRDQHQGEIPESLDVLRSLPGIGDYMAGAIASIAFDQQAAAVDGNVQRVAARINGFQDMVGSSGLKRQTTEWVLKTMPDDHPGDFNQALMELGALVCIPANPRCSQCPVQSFCAAFAVQKTDQWPVRAQRKRPTDEPITVLVVTDPENRIAMRKRTESLLKGMWEFVIFPGRLSKKELQSVLEQTGFAVREIESIGTHRHVFSHRIWTMESYAGLTTAKALPGDYVWVPAAGLDDLAVPAAFRAQSEWLRQSRL